MEAYLRHFVSQHLGKATAIVEYDDERAGHVRIVFPQLCETSVVYAFVPARVAHLITRPASPAETIARIAIHQAHKQYLAGGNSALFAPGQQLAIDTIPWIGDLDALPYGGATAGYAERAR